jgi:hypothetical protein
VLSNREKGFIHYKDLVKALADNGVKFRDVKQDDGGPFSSGQWSNIKSARRQRPPPRVRYNAKALTDDTIALIQAYWLSKSRVSPSVTCFVKRKSSAHPEGEQVPVYFRQYTISKAFEMFKADHPEVECQRTSFYKHRPKNVKPPRSKFDVCPICKEADRHQAGLEEKNNLPGALMSREEITTLKGMQFHRWIADLRDKDAKKQLADIKEGQAILTMDFKANITLGKGPLVDSHVWFCAPQRTVFGVAAFFRSGEKIYKIMFTVVSAILMHDSRTVINMLDKCVLHHPVFHHFKARNLVFWMDNAPNHFRTKEMLAGFHDISKDAAVDSLEINFFAEYHGKSECDRHFGYISQVYSAHCSRGINDDVETTEDFMRVYKDHLMEHGSHVVPAAGACLDELLAADSAKLNVICVEFNYDGVSLDPLSEAEEATQAAARAAHAAAQDADYDDDDEIEDDQVDDEDFNNAAPAAGSRVGKKQKRKTGSFAIKFPYTRKLWKEKTGFVFSNWYSFRFKSSRALGNYLECRLAAGRAQKKVPYEIKTQRKPKYTLRIGISTSARKRYSSCKRSYQKWQSHFEDDDNPPF